ncbi:MAG: hypothetical protein JNJ71_18850 [Rubrivivax sp.]|nr:hypothetical protein [Rubrivivax sp.]
MIGTPKTPCMIARALLIVGGLAILLALSSSGWAQVRKQPEATLVHGPFEIMVSARSISRGTFPNQGGNPFATREVADYKLRWRGRPVATPSGGDRFWRVLRLTDAPRPALLLVTTGFTLATENAAGQLTITPVVSRSSSLAELQWLDALAGQPGAAQSFGIELLPELEAATTLVGGRWLRPGAWAVLNVATLRVYPIRPWVPVAPGQPMTELNREGDRVRAFSPGQTKYVLLASGPDHAQPSQPTQVGLMVVDIGTGMASVLPMDRRRFRFAADGEVDAKWVHHHFEWARSQDGAEALRPRASFTPWPWRAHLWETRPGSWQLDVRRIDTAFLPVLRKVAGKVPGAHEVVSADSTPGNWALELDGCVLRAAAHAGTDADGHVTSIWPKADRPAESCTGALRKLAAAIDAELATGRHDALLKLD